MSLPKKESAESGMIIGRIDRPNNKGKIQPARNLSYTALITGIVTNIRMFLPALQKDLVKTIS